ncbi:prepilin peptidase [uncultured Azohydromonas sp.]|jgi:Flp pilus assembly protein, protease CpaA|uniref:A24 family peptidase n=1 Tax=uncultured Azohydromonas sp. TaxID=487342 RepID=UPI0026019465|nr:prepilin peptidase [uncultured Azohydromonas sp.]
MTLQWLSLLMLAGLLVAAVVSDVRSRRIPNALVVYGAALGLLFQALAPAGSGLLLDGGVGLPAALLGGLAGLGLFLPFYALRLMGAGDVKLLAMVGIWLGAPAILKVALWTALAGGVLSVVVALFTGQLRQVLRNTFFMLAAVRPAQGVGSHLAAGTRLPYAVAIATGTALEMARLLSA